MHNMIMEAMLVLTLSTLGPQNNTPSNPARLAVTSQMFATMAACERTQYQLMRLYDRRSGALREFNATVSCVSTE